jgi:uncharacterized protein YciI
MTCLDKPGALELRMATREAHLAYVKARLDKVRLAGPLLDENDGMIGSHFILEADDLAAARAFSDQDPYARAGLFQRVDVHAFRASIGQV